MSPRTAGFSNRDYFKLNGKIGLHRAVRSAGLASRGGSVLLRPHLLADC